MTQKIQFRCLQCGKCCKTKHLCLYASELKRAKFFAQKFDVELKLEPLRQIIDETCQKIIVLIYKVKRIPCPFFSNEMCLIHDDKFIACRKYPISNWIDLGSVMSFLGLNNEFYEIDEKCSYIKTNTDFKEGIKTNPISLLLPNEFKATSEDKKIWLDLYNIFKTLKKQKKIKIVAENRLKKNNPERLKQILSNWEKIPADNFLNQIN